MMLANLWKLVAVVMLMVAAYSFWTAHDEKQKRKEAELSIGLASSRMINLSFQRKNAIIVSRLAGDVVTHQECRGTLFNPEQRTKAPAVVEYRVSLKDIGKSAYGWNERENRLTIRIPPVVIDRPNVDLTKQVVRQKGAFISRECGLVLQRKTSNALVAAAFSEARKPENMMKAREAARSTIHDLATSVLKGAGMSAVQVSVVLPDEVPQTSNGERWDESRPLEQVLQ